MLDIWKKPDFILRFTDFEVNTTDVTNVQNTTADFSGAIVSTGNSTVLEKGFVWSNNLKKQPNVTTGKKMVVNAQNAPFAESGPGQNDTTYFSGQMTDLLPGSTYNARAYAINATDTTYGTSVSFTAGGVMDTLGIIKAHGPWKIYEGAFFNLITNQSQSMGRPIQDSLTSKDVRIF